MTSLTIGNFDGVHLGHRAILDRAQERGGSVVVYTFSNHPAEVLRSLSIPKLSTLPHRMKLLKEAGVETTYLTPFTLPFSRQTAREFLTDLHRSTPFSHLVLGYDAVIGCDRVSDLAPLGKELGFSVEYLDPAKIDGQIVSSSTIRAAIQNGELEWASRLLGRPYSILATVEQGAGKGGVLGFPTANLAVQELALPPFGVYAVEALFEGEYFPAIANLGKAPTLHQDRPPLLEVHLIGREQHLYGKELEVVFRRFLRPERKFENVQDLKEQIRCDLGVVSK